MNSSCASGLKMLCHIVYNMAAIILVEKSKCRKYDCI